ncbi:MAG: hypothetical protein J6B32_04480 [Spirochaetaceae bacterium]|nr:hypothetical protein [Spirochaetaceae bacterium]
MDNLAENLLIQFLRTQCGSFTVKDIMEGLDAIGIKTDSRDITSFLTSVPSVFALQNGRYVTRAGAFTDSYFSIRPTKAEVLGNFLLVGHRCIPFVDYDNPAGSTRMLFGNDILPQKEMEFSVADAFPYFSLYGEEYALQYMLSDAASDQNIRSQLEDDMGKQIKLTVVDMTEVYKSCNFQVGDMLSAMVVDWNKSIVAIKPVCEKRETPFQSLPVDKKRAKWCSVLENALLESFILYGPGLSIEDQLAKVFFTYHYDLCNPYADTIEHFLKKSKKIGIEYYGVETRLWYKGKEVPAVGVWMSSAEDENNQINHLYGCIQDSPLSFPVLQEVLDACILDCFFNKITVDNNILKKMFPENLILSETEKKGILNIVFNRKEELEKKYNWFADYEIGSIRNKLLKLYMKIASFVFELDNVKFSLQTLPQQPIVILTQLLNHSRFMLESIVNNEEISKDDLNVIEISIENMNYNFEEVFFELSKAVKQQHKKQFSLIKASNQEDIHGTEN